VIISHAYVASGRCDRVSVFSPSADRLVKRVQLGNGRFGPQRAGGLRLT
jgi:hypothetical protein